MFRKFVEIDEYNSTVHANGFACTKKRAGRKLTTYLRPHSIALSRSQIMQVCDLDSVMEFGLLASFLVSMGNRGLRMPSFTVAYSQTGHMVGACSPS